MFSVYIHSIEAEAAAGYTCELYYAGCHCGDAASMHGEPWAGRRRGVCEQHAEEELRKADGRVQHPGVQGADATRLSRPLAGLS